MGIRTLFGSTLKEGSGPVVLYTSGTVRDAIAHVLMEAKNAFVCDVLASEEWLHCHHDELEPCTHGDWKDHGCM